MPRVTKVTLDTKMKSLFETLWIIVCYSRLMLDKKSWEAGGEGRRKIETEWEELNDKEGSHIAAEAAKIMVNEFHMVGVLSTFYIILQLAAVRVERHHSDTERPDLDQKEVDLVHELKTRSRELSMAWDRSLMEQMSPADAKWERQKKKLHAMVELDKELAAHDSLMADRELERQLKLAAATKNL